MKIDAIAAQDSALLQYDYLTLMNMTKSNKGLISTKKLSKRPVTKTNAKDFLWENRSNPVIMRALLKRLNPMKNMYYMLLFMPRLEREKFFYQVPHSLLVKALRFFSKEVLLRFLMTLKKQFILRMFVRNFKLKKLLAFFPRHILIGMMMSKQIEKPMLVNSMRFLPLDQLRKFFQGLTGIESKSLQKREILGLLMGLKKEDIMLGMRFLDYKSIHRMTLHLTEKNPELLMRIPDMRLHKVLASFPKQMIAQMMDALDDDILLRLMWKLPDRYMSWALSDMDPKMFMDVMLSQYSNLLIDMAVGSTGAAS